MGKDYLHLDGIDRVKWYLNPHLKKKVSYIKRLLKQSKYTTKFVEHINLPNYDEEDVFRIRYEIVYSSNNENLTDVNLICHVEVLTNYQIYAPSTYRHLENFKYNTFSIREERMKKIKKLNLI
jgi:hypothetical protein